MRLAKQQEANIFKQNNGWYPGFGLEKFISEKQPSRVIAKKDRVVK
jgi:hypothetical protein